MKGARGCQVRSELDSSRFANGWSSFTSCVIQEGEGGLSKDGPWGRVKLPLKRGRTVSVLGGHTLGVGGGWFAGGGTPFA